MQFTTQTPSGNNETPTYSKQALLTMDNGSEASEMASENKFGPTVPVTKAIGKTTEHTAKASLSTSTAMSTRAIG